MTAHVAVLAKPRADRTEGAAKYSQGVQSLLAEAGVKPAFRGAVTQTISGSDTPATIMVLDFPDADAAAAFFRRTPIRHLSRFAIKALPLWKSTSWAEDLADQIYPVGHPVCCLAVNRS